MGSSASSSPLQPHMQISTYVTVWPVTGKAPQLSPERLQRRQGCPEPVPADFESSNVKLEQLLAWSAALETCRDAAWKLASPGQPFTVKSSSEFQPLVLLNHQQNVANVVKADAFL